MFMSLGFLGKATTDVELRSNYCPHNAMPVSLQRTLLWEASTFPRLTLPCTSATPSTVTRKCSTSQRTSCQRGGVEGEDFTQKPFSFCFYSSIVHFFAQTGQPPPILRSSVWAHSCASVLNSLPNQKECFVLTLSCLCVCASVHAGSQVAAGVKQFYQYCLFLSLSFSLFLSLSFF